MIGELRFYVFTRLPVVRFWWKLEEIKLEPSRTFLYSPETWILAGKPNLQPLMFSNLFAEHVFDLIFSSPAGFARIPGSEPIHLDLENLFLLSSSKESFDFRCKSEKNLPFKLSYFDLDAGFGSFPAVPREDFSRRIRICGQKCSILASRGLNIGKTYPIKVLKF